MPELPEVEIIKRAIEPRILHKQVRKVVVRNRMLRWQVPQEIEALEDQAITDVVRRGKFLLLATSAGTVIVHLGMTGHLYLTDAATPPTKHDHVDIQFHDGQILRLRDPRMFGAVLWTDADPQTHKLLVKIGPEPLDGSFDGKYLFKRSRGKTRPIKVFIMDGTVLAGVGNIYASEALFRAGIDPHRAAGQLSEIECDRMATAIKEALLAAIDQGEKWLQVKNRSHIPQHFSVTTAVYAKEGAPCPRCGNQIRRSIIAARSSYSCSNCQT